MSFSIQRATSDGTLQEIMLSLVFISRSDISVTVGDVLQVAGVDYTWETDSLISFTAPVPNGLEVVLRRSTDLAQLLNTFSLGAVFNNATMDENFEQLLFVAQEAKEGGSLTDVFNDVDMHGNTFQNLQDAVNEQSPVTLAQLNAYAVDSAAVLRQELANGTPFPVDAAVVGRSVVVVDSIKDLLTPALSGRTDVLVYVRRYWAGLASTSGGGLFYWLGNPKTTHDGGARISPTVPWDGSSATHAAFLAGTGETDPTGSGYWLRVAHVTNRFPTDYGATASAATVPDNKYIFDQFETKWPGVLADLGGSIYRVSAFPSGARYMNGSFLRISDSKVIDAGWSDAMRVGNRNTLIGRNTATNLTTNRYEQLGGRGYNLTALGDGALYSAGNNVKHNTAVGPNALYNNQYARYNVAIGLEALYALTGNSNDEDTGSRNVAIGDNASRFNQGDQNIALGRNAMQVNTTGRQNVYIGSACGGGIGPVGLDGVTIQNPFPTTGLMKTAVGAVALNWAYADNATAFGGQALEHLKGGVNNSAFGNRALRLLESNLSPTGTVRSTAGAGSVNWTRTGTTVTVTNAGHSNSPGNWAAVTFVSGVPSNVVNVTQYVNITTVSAGASWTFDCGADAAAVMAASGAATVVEVYRNIVQATNDNNTAHGNDAGQVLLTGTENAFFGQAAGFNLTSAVQVTALGRSALRTMQSGSAATSLTNCTGVGYNASVSGDNQVQLGNSLTTTYVYGTVQNRSDERDKADIAETELGIEFILGLEAIGYRWDMREDYIEVVEREGGTTETIVHAKDGSRKRNRVHQGFRAQQVRDLCERLGVDFGGLQHHAKGGGNDVFSLGYDEFIAPLTKAVQQCWARLDRIEERLAAIESK